MARARVHRGNSESILIPSDHPKGCKNPRYRVRLRNPDQRTCGAYFR